MIDLATLLFILAGFCWGFVAGVWFATWRTRRQWRATNERLGARQEEAAVIQNGAPQWDQPTLDREETA